MLACAPCVGRTLDGAVRTVDDLRAFYGDSEIRAQAAKMIGDVRDDRQAGALVPLLEDGARSMPTFALAPAKRWPG